MRIASGVTDQYIYFVAVDATDLKTRETGLATFTVYRSRNGGVAAAFTTPTINETDVTNMPGVYELLLDEDMTIDAGDETQAMVFHITHSGMAPVTREIELYRPKITAGNTLGVASDGDISGNVEGSVVGSVGSLATQAKADVNAEVDTAIVDARLDELLAADSDIDGAAPPTVGSVFHELLTKTAGSFTYDQTTDSLEAVRDNMGTAQTGDSFARLGAPAGASVSADIAAIEAQTDDIGAAGAGLTAVPWNAAWDAEVQSEVQDAIEANDLDHLTTNGTSVPAIVAGTFFDQLMDDGTAVYDRTTDSLQAIRDRGDAAWVTGGAGSITDILNVIPLIPEAIDIADTATWRLGLMLTNAVDDLPSTAEITPGTISIERKAVGATSWTAVVTDSACSEAAGMVYFDEVFDFTTGYAPDDSLRITFKSQKITVAANDYEVTDATGRFFYTWIRGETDVLDSGVLQGAGTSQATLRAAASFADGILAGCVLQIIKNTGAGQSRVISGNTLATDVVSLDVDWTSGQQPDSTSHYVIRRSPPAPATVVATIDATDKGTLVDLVYDEASSGHTTAGTYGKAISDILVDTGTTLDARIPAALTGGRMDASVGAMAANVVTASALAADAVDEIWDEVMEGTVTARQSMRLANAANGGETSGMATTTAVVRDVSDTKPRITATVDADGNRSAVTLDLT